MGKQQTTKKLNETNNRNIYQKERMNETKRRIKNKLPTTRNEQIIAKLNREIVPGTRTAYAYCVRVPGYAYRVRVRTQYAYAVPAGRKCQRRRRRGTK